MESRIKSEPSEKLNCEEESDNDSTTQNSHPYQSKQCVRLDEMDDSLNRKSNINQPQTNVHFYSLIDFANVMLHHDYTMPKPNQSEFSLDTRQLQKYRKREENLIFHSSFLNLVQNFLSHAQNEVIAARYHSSGIKANRSISSKFIKRPEVNAILRYLLKQANLLENSTLENTPIFDSSNENENSLCATNEKSNSERQEQVVVSNFKNSSLDLPANASQMFGNLIDEKLQNFVKQKDYDQLNKNVDNLLKRNLESKPSSEAALSELKTDLNNLKKECAALRLAVEQSQASKRQLQNELQTVDKLLHQRKLIIRNIQVCDPGQPVNSVKNLFSKKFDLGDIQIVDCSIIPSKNTFKSSNKECLSIELDSPQTCKAIFRQAHKLKNTGIFIESELSSFQRKRKSKLMVLRKELLRRKPGLKVLVRGTTLLVNGNIFYWDDVEGLCHDNKKEANKLDGIQYLNRLSGLDLKDFLDILRTYTVKIL